MINFTLAHLHDGQLTVIFRVQERPPLLPQMIYINIVGKIPYPNAHWPLPIIGNLHTFVLRDHPYITSAYFRTFSDPPTHPMSAYIVLNVSKKCHFFLTPHPPSPFADVIFGCSLHRLLMFIWRFKINLFTKKSLYIQTARPSDRQPSEYKFHFGSINLLCPYNYGLRKSTKKYLPCSLPRGGGGTESTPGPYILPGKKQNLY